MKLSPMWQGAAWMLLLTGSSAGLTYGVISLVEYIHNSPRGDANCYKRARDYYENDPEMKMVVYKASKDGVLTVGECASLTKYRIKLFRDAERIEADNDLNAILVDTK